MATGNDVLRIAAGELGYSRWDDPAEGSKYGRDYATRHGAYFAASGVPYCDMFVTWCLRRAGITGFDSAYVPGRVNTARAHGWLVLREDAQPGDLVCFDWDDDGEADHIGIVEVKYVWSYQTIEGNTSTGSYGSQSNGGVVARRVRSFDTVCAVIRPPYSAPARSVVPEGTLAVDGEWGKATTRALQRINGTPVDGIVSSQYAPNRVFLPAADWDGSGWQWEGDTAEGSQLIACMQRAFGVKSDGITGMDTVRAMQRYYHVSVDGYMGVETVRALQRAVNQQNARR
ncbi:CHAP domain-containing protein [Schaalia radingae]|uniref:CHAP domain-containing protein n=1 Tax=Schaalia radingae TaxID=131110 RepID=A0ABY0V4U5_9ACTO|nr:CHAP domain-containing protein [Schaalia radingae]SDT85693.1 CHAP domain-containing protein [Schaalia radingae]